MKRNPLWFREHRGYESPWWSGLVFRDYPRDQVVCSVVPLSLALRVGLLLWQWARYPFRSNLIEERLSARRDAKEARP